MSISSVQAMGLEYAITLIGILLGRKAFTFKNHGMNYFWRFIVVLNVFLLINIPIRLFELKLYEFETSVISWLYAFSIIFMTLTMFYWFVFNLKLLDCSFLNTSLKTHIAFIPALIIVPLCIANRWTGWLYTIEDSAYCRGSLFILQGLISYIYLIVNLVYLVYCFVTRKSRKFAQFSLYAGLPCIAGIVLQILYGGSFLLTGIVICASIMYIDICLEKQKDAELTKMKELLVQTAETLASTIDAKDEYTHGHSARVAQYSRMIAEKAGYPEDYVERIYFSGLLHDVGKIGISDEIINKKGKLTSEEYNIVKQHSMKGRDILAHIRKLPYLTMGAKYHHERYDGMGYPEGLKATDIPDIARIIALADAYDAMTSNRSYRNILSQEVVRQEIINGKGKQFDPYYADILLKLIDKDKNYEMKQEVNPNEIYCREYYKKFFEGGALSPCGFRMHFHSEKFEPGHDNLPTIVLFDAVDSRIHIEEHEKFFYCYVNYCDIRVDGVYKNNSARKMELSVTELKPRKNNLDTKIDVEVTAVKWRDHVVIKICDGFTEINATAVLTDSSRFAYIGVTGKKCYIRGITCEQSSEITPESSIKRIADEVKYFDKPDGDIPNIQVDGWRTETTKAVSFEKELSLSFFMKTSPFARLIWHCPIILLYESDDGTVGGKNFREFAFIRMDGEIRQADPYSSNDYKITTTEEFKDWNAWKLGNKKGRNIEVNFKRENNRIFLRTACGGIKIENTTTISKDFKKLYVAMSGDQVLLEAIKINKRDS